MSAPPLVHRAGFSLGSACRAVSEIRESLLQQCLWSLEADVTAPLAVSFISTPLLEQTNHTGSITTPPDVQVTPDGYACL